MRRTKTFTITYNYFEPGTLVVPTSTRCPLVRDDRKRHVFKVTKCYEPNFPGEDGIVFVEGHKNGVETYYLREATDADGDAGSEVPWPY